MQGRSEWIRVALLPLDLGVSTSFSHNQITNSNVSSTGLCRRFKKENKVHAMILWCGPVGSGPNHYSADRIQWHLVVFII